MEEKILDIEINFLDFINQYQLAQKNDKILVAFSGGADSVVLATLLKNWGFNIALAHCNFKLRGTDSDTDENFCEQFADEMKLKLYKIQFNTNQYAKQNKISIETAARELRYNWFEKISESENYKLIATGHHLNDNIETVLLKLCAGTGINGLTGIKLKNKNIIRPLLFAKRSEIEEYCRKNNLTYRTDKSNFENKHTRNKIRNLIIPHFKDINPNFENTFAKNINIFIDIKKIYNKQVKIVKAKCVENKGKYTYINIKKLGKHKPVKTFLYELIKDYGFNSCDASDIKKSFEAEPGKIFLSGKYILLRDRKNLIIKAAEQEQSFQNIEISEFSNFVTVEGFKLSKFLMNEGFVIPRTKNIAVFDFDKIKFPIIIRLFKTGDYFYPFGLKGKKNLSDFFNDRKINKFDKENILILESDKKIMWIVNFRTDERFKISENTRTVLKIESPEE